MQKEDIWGHILPSDLLIYFTIEEVKEVDAEDGTKDIEIHLWEKNTLPSGYGRDEYESKGFFNPKRTQDFPIRGRAVYLLVKRRRWRHKLTKEEIRSDYNFIAAGAKLTEELSVPIAIGIKRYR
jgi:hypothetical protein